MLNRGRSARTAGIEGFFVGSTWPSLATGTTPARHGIHYLSQLEPGSYRYYRPSDREFVKAEPFWAALGRAGRRVAIVDVPLTRLDPTINGIQVVEWGGHDAIFGFATMPVDLAGEIEARFGAHPGGPSCDGDRTSAADYRRFIDHLVSGVATRERLTRWILAGNEWDLVMQVFTESHCAGHQTWHLHDPAHPAHDAAIAAAVGDPLEQVYRAIDASIGALVEEATGARVMVVVGHGMGHWYGAHFLLPEILFRLGVATRPSAPADRGGRLDRAWLSLPAPVRDLLRPIVRSVRRAGPGQPRPPSLGVDPATSRCFVVGNGLAVSGIRFNLAGREPDGIVEPGTGARELSDQLSGELLAITDLRTGRPLVARVRRTADLYQGPELAALPDLLVEWSAECPTGSAALAGGKAATVRARSPKIGTVEGINEFGRSGEHRPDGLVIVAGPGIRPGRFPEPVRLIDIAPTIASWLGVAMPGADGRPVSFE